MSRMVACVVGATVGAGTTMMGGRVKGMGGNVVVTQSCSSDVSVQSNKPSHRACIGTHWPVMHCHSFSLQAKNIIQLLISILI